MNIFLFFFRDCIKGEEGENKKISGSVNLMVIIIFHLSLSGQRMFNP